MDKKYKNKLQQSFPYIQVKIVYISPTFTMHSIYLALNITSFFFIQIIINL